VGHAMHGRYQRMSKRTDEWPTDEAFGRELARREIRRAIEKPLRELRQLHREANCICKLDPAHGPPECTVGNAIRAIDKATRAPRKARAK
jgi:hypothetical protein